MITNIMDEIDEMMQACQTQIDRVKHIVSTMELSYVETSNPFGQGVGIAFSETDFVVLSVSAGGSGTLNIECGVLADVSADRLAILDLCNRRTQDNPAYPVYLHDAEAGWDVLLGTMIPVQLAIDAPGYLSSLINGLPTLAAEARNEFLAAGVQGRTYRWDADDLDRLTIRSMI